eukprot:scaffold7243_cov394-Prasinococcus_capsulatus_cf.AAC.1
METKGTSQGRVPAGARRWCCRSEAHRFQPSQPLGEGRVEQYNRAGSLAVGAQTPQDVRPEGGQARQPDLPPKMAGGCTRRGCALGSLLVTDIGSLIVGICLCYYGSRKVLDWRLSREFAQCQTQIPSPSGDLVDTVVDVQCVGLAAAGRWGQILLRATGETDSEWGERAYREVIGIGDTLIPEQHNTTWLEECQDDPIFDAGVGGCETYAVGQYNSEFCREDGADIACPKACRKCSQEPLTEPECKDSEEFDAGFGKCDTYQQGRPNHVRCGIDGAALACPVSCETCCRDDPAFDDGWGNCTTYAPGKENAMWCVQDGAEASCPVSCERCDTLNQTYAALASEDRNTTCVDDPFFDSGWGGCDTYAKDGTNSEWCAKDGASVACPVSCGTCQGEAGNKTEHSNVVRAILPRPSSLECDVCSPSVLSLRRCYVRSLFKEGR